MTRRPGRAFYFRLAGHLGMTVRELLSRIDSREITEWIVYERAHGPLGDRRLDHIGAMITAAIVNANRGKGPPKRVEDFLPSWGGKPIRVAKSADELYAKALELNRKMGGSVVT